jgi:hypothetical protein
MNTINVLLLLTCLLFSATIMIHISLTRRRKHLEKEFIDRSSKLAKELSLACGEMANGCEGIHQALSVMRLKGASVTDKDFQQIIEVKESCLNNQKVLQDSLQGVK